VQTVAVHFIYKMGSVYNHHTVYIVYTVVWRKTCHFIGLTGKDRMRHYSNSHYL